MLRRTNFQLPYICHMKTRAFASEAENEPPRRATVPRTLALLLNFCTMPFPIGLPAGPPRSISTQQGKLLRVIIGVAEKLLCYARALCYARLLCVTARCRTRPASQCRHASERFPERQG